MRYVINKRTKYIYPYSEALLAKKDVEEIEEEKALPLLKEQQRGDIGFRDEESGGEVAAAPETPKAEQKENRVLTAAQKRQALIEKQFSDFDKQKSAPKPAKAKGNKASGGKGKQKKE